MSKTPEEYFQEQSFSVPGRSGGQADDFSAAELTFIRKYMGLDAPDTLRKMGLADKAQVLENEPEQLELPPQPVPAVVSGLLGDSGEAAPLEPARPTVSGAYAAPADKTPMESLQMTLDRTMPEQGRPEHGGPEKTRPAVVDVQVAEEAAAPVASATPAEPVEIVAPADPQESLVELAEPAPVQEAEPAEELELVEAVEPAVVAEAVEPVATAQPEEPVLEVMREVVQEPILEAAPAAPAAEVVPAAEIATPAAPAAPTPFSIAANYDEDLLDNSDLATYRETTRQQFQTIHMALDGLRKDGGDMPLADAIYRSLVTVQNSSSYMELDEIKVYAERTAGLVDQGRKSGLDFSLMVDIISQESGILSDMVSQAIEKLTAGPSEAAMPSEAATPAEVAAPVEAAAPESAPAPAEAVSIAEAAQPDVAEAAAPPALAEETPAPTPPTPPAPPASEEAPAAVAPVQPEPASEEKAEPPQETVRPVDKDTGKPRTASIAEIYEGMDIQEALDHYLRHEPELQMVAFYLGNQEFTVPTVIVQEVIHYSEPAKLPVAPPFVAGVINLRGKVTPLVYLRDILEVNQERKTEDCFIIICRFQGLQVGLIIERVHTMYRVPQSDIDWGIEQHLGINVDYVSGLLKLNENLVGIVSVDRIVTNLLQNL